MNLKVTVIMPMYNSEDYLEESIKSILNQSYKNFELLIINDGSTDSSLDIVNKYKNEDKRIRLVNNDGNKGLPYTRNRGLELARGEYIALMDADDISYPNRLEEQVKYLDNNLDVMVIASNFDFIENNKLRKVMTINNKLSIELENYLIGLKLMFYNPILNSTAMFRKNYIEKFDITYKKDCFVAQDYMFWIDCKEKGNFHIINKKLLAYRQGHENITKNSIKNRSAERKKLIDEMRKKALINNGFNLSTKDIDIFNKVFSDPYINLNNKDFIEINHIIDNMTNKIQDKNKKKLFANLSKYQIARRLQLTDISLYNKLKIIMYRFKYQSNSYTFIAIMKILKSYKNINI